MISEKPYLWKFSEDVDFERLAGAGFTDPFRYVPDPLTLHAGQMIISRLAEWASMAEGTHERALERSFAEGKMLGVLVCRTGFLAAFSGTVKGQDGKVTASVDGFVPPIIDLTEKKGHFKRKEAVISLLNKEIETILSSPEYNGLKKELLDACFHHLNKPHLPQLFH